jgi:hypothetical protein
MRLLRVAQACYPDVTGGGPYHVRAVNRDQAAMGNNVTVSTVVTDWSETVDRTTERFAGPLGE